MSFTATDLPTTFEPLKQQLLAAAEEFSSDAQPLGEILSGIVDDVQRACQEPLEIFPVCHHSPSSAAQMVHRLRNRPPRVIYLECCEDMRAVLLPPHTASWSPPSDRCLRKASMKGPTWPTLALLRGRAKLNSEHDARQH